MIAALKKIPTGRRDATRYHHMCLGIITYLFYPHLINPALELEIDQGRKRVDLSFLNSSEYGFFKDRKDDPFCLSREIIIECKNYTDDIANPELDQMTGRFDPRRSRFGIIFCRMISDVALMERRCKDAFQAQRGLVLVFDDDDVGKLLRTDPLFRDTALNEMLRQKLRQISR